MGLEEVKCRLCGFFHLSGSCPKVNHSPTLPPADPWDRQTGTVPVTDFDVTCDWTVINDEWASVEAFIHLYDATYALSKLVEVFRVKRTVGNRQVESPELVSLAWTKKMLGSGGVPVLGLYEQNPGHVSVNDGAGNPISRSFRWWASVGSRLSVAVVRLDGNLAGQARLVPVE